MVLGCDWHAAVGKNWDFFGKLGATENYTKFVGSSRHTDLLAGAGIGCNATQNVGVRLEYKDFGELPNDANGSGTKLPIGDSA